MAEITINGVKYEHIGEAMLFDVEAEISRLKSAHSDMAELYRKSAERVVVLNGRAEGILAFHEKEIGVLTEEAKVWYDKLEASDSEVGRLLKRNSELIDVVTYLKELLYRVYELRAVWIDSADTKKIASEICAIKQAQEEADNAETV